MTTHLSGDQRAELKRLAEKIPPGRYSYDDGITGLPPENDKGKPAQLYQMPPAGSGKSGPNIVADFDSVGMFSQTETDAVGRYCGAMLNHGKTLLADLEAAERDAGDWRERFAELMNLYAERDACQTEDERNEVMVRYGSWTVSDVVAPFIKDVAICTNCEAPAVDGVLCAECGVKP